MVFEVYSIGWFGRYVTEGYGYTSIPLYGTIDTEIKTWRPLGSLSSRIYDYYVGGSSSLYNNRFVGIPNPKQRSINRYGVVTESSGSIRFKANVTRSDPRNILISNEEDSLKKQQSIKVRKTVDDILTNFKATGSVSSHNITKTLLRASTSSSRDLGGLGLGSGSKSNSMNTSKLTGLLNSATASGAGSGAGRGGASPLARHRAGSPGGVNISASVTGLSTNIKEIVKDNSRYVIYVVYIYIYSVCIYSVYDNIYISIYTLYTSICVLWHIDF